MHRFGSEFTLHLFLLPLVFFKSYRNPHAFSGRFSPRLINHLQSTRVNLSWYAIQILREIHVKPMLDTHFCHPFIEMDDTPCSTRDTPTLVSTAPTSLEDTAITAVTAVTAVTADAADTAMTAGNWALNRQYERTMIFSLRYALTGLEAALIDLKVGVGVRLVVEARSLYWDVEDPFDSILSTAETRNMVQAKVKDLTTRTATRIAEIKGSTGSSKSPPTLSSALSLFHVAYTALSHRPPFLTK